MISKVLHFLSIICCSCCYRGYTGRYGPGPSHYEVVVPQKVTADGEFISHLLPHHYKRSYYNNNNKLVGDIKIYYSVPIAGESHYLELVPNRQIFSPGMVVESFHKNALKRRIRKNKDTQCHFRGMVNGDANSRVALSTCYGLSGYLRTKRGYFIIEPITGHNPWRDARFPHLLYQVEHDRPERPNCQIAGKLDKRNSGCACEEMQGIHNNNNNSAPTVAEFHIEAMVTLDKTILNYHKAVDVENYVLTVFNMAHDLYHDASLGMNINLAIVRLIRLEEEDNAMNLAINKNAVKTLEAFTKWQKEVNPGDDTHPNHHDIGILLTRTDICGDDNNCGVLGAARLSGMCDPDYAAILCEDNGLRMGFTIAHEIAHTLAIPHDSIQESGCNWTLPDGFSTVMSPAISIRTEGWSKCSHKFLKLFIDSGLGKCLYDPPTDHSFTLVDLLPGVTYGGDFQCRELLGPSSGLCDTGLECNNLICFVEGKGCVETHSAAAPGTNCGENKWCVGGKCIAIGEKPGAIDGGWGQWGNWSECSRTCGSGVSIGERHCDQPQPVHNGKYCSGERTRHRICNTDPCDVDQPLFREVQCNEFNDWIYPEDEQVHTWNHYNMPEENPCILYCVNDRGTVASLRPRVVDGTPCQPGSRDICIDGLCRVIPCDFDLESNAIEDACGVCHGDGTSCRVINGEQFFEQSLTDRGKKPFLQIPKGSVNIKIEESEPTESKIQVRSKDGSVTYVKGDSVGAFDILGLKGWLGLIRTKQEALYIPGPICDDISIWIVTRENVNMKYSYGIKATEKRTPSFSLDYLSWSRCSAQCGPGTQIAVPQCKEKLSGLVDQKFCKCLEKPKEEIRQCEMAPCTPRWMIGDWQKCSKCPHGNRVRFVKCVKPTGEGEGESDVVSDSECADPKPKRKEKCTCRRPESDVKKTNCPKSNNPVQENYSKSQSFLQDNSKLGRIVIDKEKIENVSLTVHLEPKEDTNTDDETKNGNTLNLQGHEAMEFLEKSGKEEKGNSKV